MELRIVSSFSGWIPSATEITFDVGKMSHSKRNITLQVAKKWAARAMSHLFLEDSESRTTRLKGASETILAK